ncbi:MAG: hypothetical protein V4484_15950 [Pseudomonadota bacterium]
MARPDATGGWIGGPGFDAFFFFGSGVIAVAAGLLMLAAPALVLPVWFAWIWLVEGPHLFATWQRAYLDTAYRRQHRRMLAASLLWFLPGPLALMVSQLTGQPGPFLLFLGAVGIWSFHHAVRQHHGIQSIYQRLGGAGEPGRTTDRRLLHAVLWMAFALFLFGHPLNRQLIGLGSLQGAEALAIGALACVLALCVLAWAALLVLRWRRGEALKAGMFGLFVAAGTVLFSLFVVGMREPLLAGAVTTEQLFMAATLIGGTLHGIQYLGIVIATERRRAGAAAGSLSARLGKAPLAAYALMLVASFAYVALNLARGASPRWAFADPFATQLFLALYWGLFCHHFWLDQKIWKPSQDARLRAELGLGTV